MNNGRHPEFTLPKRIELVVPTPVLGDGTLSVTLIDAQNVLDDDELSEAHDLATQTVRTLDDGFDTLVRTVQLVGESVHADELSEDLDFWRDCSRVSGPGYRDRINGYNRDWFETKHEGEAEARVLALVKQKWSESIESVRGLLAPGLTKHE